MAQDDKQKDTNRPKVNRDSDSGKFIPEPARKRDSGTGSPKPGADKGGGTEYGGPRKK